MAGNKITVLRAGQAFAEFDLKPQMIIGRTPQADLQLEDPQMSRAHAAITKEGNRYFLTDMSTNGIVLNGQRIPKQMPVEVIDGSVAHLTSFELRFQIGDGELVPATRQISPGQPTKNPVEKGHDRMSEPPAAAPLPVGTESGKKGARVWSSGAAHLTVADIIEETDDVKTFRFVGDEPTLFSFQPGQFITLSLDIDGEEVNRSYSISSSPSRPHTLEVTIKRVPDGLVSNWMNDHVKLGDKLRVKGPAGKFSCFNYPSQKILFVAAGSGITPIMSMSRWIVDTAADVDVVLLCSARTPSDIVFRKELELLSARHSNFKVYITVTQGWRRTESWTGFSGRNSCDMLRMVCPDYMERHAFMCGPKPFADSVKDQLKELGFPLANLHTESFGTGRVAKGAKKKEEASDVPAHSQQHTPAPQPVPSVASASTGVSNEVPPPSTPVAAPAAFNVNFKKAGVVVQTNGQSPLLDLAEVNGVDIDYACRAGSCLTCKVMCSSGEVHMSEDAELPDDERTAGYILACCSSPRSDLVIEA